jgi:tetratricopeptide (TPR) repeat protein
VGLSIILNDIGRYEEAKQVFKDAQEKLEESKKQSDPFIEQRICKKHLELGDLYVQISRFDEALEQFLKAKKLVTRPGDVILRVADCFMKMNKSHRAIQELQIYLREYPQDNAARTRLGTYLYQTNRVFEAVEEWERVLLRDPNHAEAKHCLQLAQETRLTEIAAHDVGDLPQP